MNEDKCEFFKSNVKYLGHIINKRGELRTHPNKVDTILNVPVPSGTTKIFLRMVYYYRKFVHNMSDALVPLHNLLKKIINLFGPKVVQNCSIKCRKFLCLIRF